MPLLYESGGETRFDRVVVVTAPGGCVSNAVMHPRTTGRPGCSTRREKIKRADYHFVNTGTPEELDQWVAGLMEELTNETP